MGGAFSAEELFGVQPMPGSAGVAAPTQHIGVDESATRGWRALIDPRNPLVWFGALLLVTVGAAGVAGSVRLGPAKVSGSVGKSS